MIDANPYELYDSEQVSQATQEIDAAILKALADYPNALETAFEKGIYPTLQKWESIGATDTASREAVWAWMEEQVRA